MILSKPIPNLIEGYNLAFLKLCKRLYTATKKARKHCTRYEFVSVITHVQLSHAESHLSASAREHARHRDHPYIPMTTTTTRTVESNFLLDSLRGCTTPGNL